MTEELFLLPGCSTNHPGQGRTYLARADSRAGPRPVLLALHGSGREAASYRDVPFYRYQRDCALEAGYLFACISNGPDTWGTDDGLRNVELLYDHLSAHFGIAPRWVPWATSAGGALMHRLVARHPDLVRGAIGTFAVYDLLDSFGRSPGCGRAWGAATLAELDAAVRGRNPPELLDRLTSTAYLLFHGREDLVVPHELHSLRFRDEANVRGGRVELVLTPGGHSTDNSAVYDHARILDCLRAWRAT